MNDPVHPVEIRSVSTECVGSAVLDHLLCNDSHSEDVREVVAETIEEQVAAGGTGERIQLVVVDGIDQSVNVAHAVVVTVAACPGIQGGLQRRPVSVAPLNLPDLGPEAISGDGGHPFGLLADVELAVTVELGRRRLPLADILRLTTGSIIELEKLVGEPLDIYANGRLIAEGEAVVIDEQFGIRITSLVTTKTQEKAFR